MASVMLSTLDNPYNPHKDYEDWYRYDMDMGYNSCAYLDRIAKTSSQLSDAENDAEIERAIDEIIKYDYLCLYIKIKENDSFNYEQNKALFDSFRKLNE